jgi:hypothetical protein
MRKSGAPAVEGAEGTAMMFFEKEKRDSFVFFEKEKEGQTDEI